MQNHNIKDVKDCTMYKLFAIVIPKYYCTCDIMNIVIYLVMISGALKKFEE